jgi:hypothetical protein
MQNDTTRRGRRRFWLRVGLTLGATHSLPMEVPDQLNRELLDFMAAHDPSTT